MPEEALEQAQEENEALDKKARKKAEKARKKEEKKEKKEKKAQEDSPEEEESGGSKIAVAAATVVFIAIWLAILALIVKMDVGGFGSTVLHPILKDVPYLNKILPETVQEEEDPVVDAQYPYSTLDEAIARIKELEVEVANEQSKTEGDSDKVSQLEAEVERLREFENKQSAFEEEKTKFYKEVVFNEKAPDISEYKAYYESIDPANAEVLYKQVVQQQEADAKVSEYATTYAEMKPKQAAAIMEKMTDDLQLVVKILQNMDTNPRSQILAAMDAEVAARITKLMEP
ncbi:MAG: hypothetical protein HFH38_03225 [Lachnospiraceae bacterium]|jgi:flagellar motility protein MotE (MotC chaperone)|nr:hypothetical protein [Lachnospiraceae bacterium]